MREPVASFKLVDKILRVLSQGMVGALVMYWLWHQSVPGQCASLAYQLKVFALPLVGVL